MIDRSLKEAWERDGFFRIDRFASPERCGELLERVVEIARSVDENGRLGHTYVQRESKLVDRATTPEACVSKVFRLHRDPVFERFAREPALLDLIEGLLGPDLDCFLSQFIFKHPEALGQPWHQDAFYFPFDRSPQVGVWLAITRSTRDNGPLWVLPGSHREPVHEVVPDRREHANFGYVEIVDHDTSDAVAVLMDPGDLLVFHSHLMHRSTDNKGDRMRAAMVYHYGEAGTVDGSEQKFGFKLPNVEWVPVRRGGRLV